MGRYKKNVIHNRIYKLLAVFTFVFILLLLRLYWIQVKDHDLLYLEALKQRGKEIELYPARGVIYDRNLIPLTNRKRVNILLTLKDNIMEDDSLKKFLLNNTSLDYLEFEKRLREANDIVEIPLKDLNFIKNGWKNVLINQKTLRYDDNNILSHVIGYINKSENRGESGIERVYDDVLRNVKKKMYSLLNWMKRIIYSMM